MLQVLKDRSASVVRSLDDYLAAGRSAVFTTSFGLEDQVLTEFLSRTRHVDEVRFVTLDTGRLFPETYDLWARSEERYGIAIHGFSPQADALDRLVRERGINGFRASIENRKACCGVRKLEPLARALEGADLWITGLRSDQSTARAATGLTEFDAERRLTKLNPLHDWSREEALAFAQQHDVPISPLHAQGFASIGCAPCTRAIAPGEPERAGRWWWEDEAAKECGLHVGADGRLVRARIGENA